MVPLVNFQIDPRAWMLTPTSTSMLILLLEQICSYLRLLPSNTPPQQLKKHMLFGCVSLDSFQKKTFWKPLTLYCKYVYTLRFKKQYHHTTPLERYLKTIPSTTTTTPSLFYPLGIFPKNGRLLHEELFGLHEELQLGVLGLERRLPAAANGGSFGKAAPPLVGKAKKQNGFGLSVCLKKGLATLFVWFQGLFNSF